MFHKFSQWCEAEDANVLLLFIVGAVTGCVFALVTLGVSDLIGTR